jgi:hypothetical protein
MHRILDPTPTQRPGFGHLPALTRTGIAGLRHIDRPPDTRILHPVRPGAADDQFTPGRLLNVDGSEV